MASYNPPTENITQFNTSLFNQPEETLSQQEADLLYLSKKNTDTSTAPLTTFNNQVNTKGGLSVGVQGVAGGLLNVNRRMRVNDANGNVTGYLDITYGSGAEAVYTSQSLSLAQTFHRFYNCASGSATPVLRLEVGDTTKIPARLEVGTDGINSTPAVFKTDIRMIDIGSPYSNFCQLYAGGNTMSYIMNAGPTSNSFHKFTASNNANASQVAFQVGYSSVNITDGVVFNTRQITSSSTASTAHQIFTDMTSGGVLTIGNSASTNTINGSSNFTSSLLSRSNLKLYEWGLRDANTITLTFPMERTIGLRVVSGSSMILNLPLATANERGMIFTFIKFGTNFNVTINTTGGQPIYPLNNLSGTPTTNTTILSSDRIMTKLAVGYYAATTYWIEVSDYSTFDRDYNNTIYPRLGQSNTFTNSNTFNQNINAKADIICLDKNSPFTNTLTINHTTSSANYTSLTGIGMNSFHNFTAYNSAGLNRVSFQVGYDQVNIPDGLLLSTRQITSSNNIAAHTLFTNMVSPAVLTIGGTTSTNTINGNTTLPNTTTFGANTTISQSGSTSTMNQTSSTGTLEFKTRQGGTPTTPLTLTSTLITLAHSTRINSSLDLWDGGTLTKNANLQVLGVSGDFSISNSNSGGNIVLETTDGSGLTQPVTINSTETSIATKIKLTGTSYNVAFPSQQNLGYYLRQVGGSVTSVVTNTYKTIYTTATQLGQGVWRIDWSVKNTITTGGTITSSQAFISTTSVDTNTPLVNTGAILRSHTSEVYATNDIQIVASSFTLTLVVATPLYLTILKTFTTGAYSYIGEITATRIA